MVSISLEIKWAIFLLCSAAWLYVSRAALRRIQAHGFYRFLAWEAITGLVVLNLEHWFKDPFSLAQLASWACLIVSLFLVIHSMKLLSQLGRPAAQRGDESLIGFEKTTTLVTAGAYRYIRHPMYSSLLFLALGAFFKNFSPLSLILMAATLFFLTATAVVEERENLKYFGEGYALYMRQTRRFIPYLF